ncbi:hypothetical protein C1Y26_35075, partial [Pseudomonas sp. MPR-R2A7]
LAWMKHELQATSLAHGARHQDIGIGSRNEAWSMFMARPFDKLAKPVGSAAPGQHFQRVRPERGTFAVNYAIDFARRAFDFEASQTLPG